MRELEGFDLEGGTARAWRRFQARLADHLAEMSEGDSLVIEVEVGEEDLDGAGPYVQFAGFGEPAMVRGEVSGNGYLAAPYALTAEQVEGLTGLGWHEPTCGPGAPEGAGSANFFVDLPVSEADRLAVMSVTTLREVLGVPHPAFLSAGDLADDEDGGSAVPAPVATAEVGEAPPTTPQSHEELCELVDAALTPLFGQTPQKDDDGDIPVPWGSSLVFVRVEQDAPVVRLFSVVVEGVTDRRRASFEVNVLNRDLRFLKFVLLGDRVVAEQQLPAWPFVPEHLRSMLTGMSQHLDELDEDLAARIGGRCALDTREDPAPDACAPSVETTSGVSADSALQTLLELDADADAEVTVDADLAAAVCAYDQELVLLLLRQSQEQEEAWRGARDQALLDGDPGEASTCEHEIVAWARTTVLLRSALRVVVERALGREPGQQPGHAGPRATTPRNASRCGRTFPPRPRSMRVVEELGDLLRAYDVDDLVCLDEKLSESSADEVEVLDFESGIEVVVGDRSEELGYPFTLADLDALLDRLGSDALSEESLE